MKRFDCLKELKTLLDSECITVTSLAGNAFEWSYLWKDGPNFYGLNLGMCLSFAAGLSLAFPSRRVVALESDGSMLLDTSALVTLADVNPPNLTVIVFDNESYARMEQTATGRRASLEQIARGAGIRIAYTVHTVSEFTSAAREALKTAEPSIVVAKVEKHRQATPTDYQQSGGGIMKARFIEALYRFPEYRERVKGDMMGD